MRLTGIEREEELFRTFATPAKRERYVELLRTRRDREKVRLSLDHFADLDPARCTRIAAGDQTPAKISTSLRALGAPETCYVMSSNSDLDTHEMQLRDALEAIVGQGCGSFICCIPRRLAYFEGESQGERYVCRG